MRNKPRIVIAGGGWAGLAAAVELADHGVAVTLLESAKQLGGRARRAPFGALPVDNGQHLLIGAYRETLRLLRTMGIPEYEILKRTPLSLRLHSGADVLAMRAPDLPAPFHLAWALLRAKGLTLGERRAALRLATPLAFQRHEVPGDITVAQWLREHRQPERVIERLWAPLCLATLNLAAEEASARLFVRVLRDTFTRDTRDSDLLFPRSDLGRVFPDPARNFVQRRGGQVRLGHRVTGLCVQGERVTGVRLGKTTLDATHLVLALPAFVSGELLTEHAPTRDLGQRLGQLDHTPIATIYLRYPATVRLNGPMVGLVGTVAQWVFDRSDSGQPGLMAVVVSGLGRHVHWDRATLAHRVAEELTAHFGWPEPEESFVIREKRAAFRCAPGIEEGRPAFATPLKGLWLAGDYTATGYPATLEGAVRSGVECARLLLADLGRSPRGPIR